MKEKNVETCELFRQCRAGKGGNYLILSFCVSLFAILMSHFTVSTLLNCTKECQLTSTLVGTWTSVICTARQQDLHMDNSKRRQNILQPTYPL